MIVLILFSLASNPVLDRFWMCDITSLWTGPIRLS